MMEGDLACSARRGRFDSFGGIEFLFFLFWGGVMVGLWAVEGKS